jgi:hypothetical protein
MVGAGAVNDTVVDCAVVPPGPAHVRMNVESSVRPGVVFDPCSGLGPDQAPEAVHEVAFDETHSRVALLRLPTTAGLALRLNAGGGGMTDTVVDCAALPPVPMQVSTYVASAVSVFVASEPWIDLAPDQAPEAVHDVALRADQFNTEAAPVLTVLGVELKFTTGAEAPPTLMLCDCTALPPTPVQVKV